MARPSERDGQSAPSKNPPAHVLVSHHEYLKRELPGLRHRMKKVLSVQGDRDRATLSRVASGLRFPALRDGDAYAQRRAHATVMLPQRTGRFVPCTRELAREPQKPCVVQRATTETNRPKMRRAELGSRSMTRHASGVVSNWVCRALAATVLFRNRLATPPAAIRTISRGASSKRIGNSFGSLRIIGNERMAVQGGNLRLPGGA